MRAAMLARPFCRVCGRVDDLHVHHIVPRRRTQKGAEDQENLIVLCAACHQGVHDHRIDLQSFLSTEEQAHAVILTGSLELARQLLCPSAYQVAA